MSRTLRAVRAWKNRRQELLSLFHEAPVSRAAHAAQRGAGLVRGVVEGGGMWRMSVGVGEGVLMWRGVGTGVGVGGGGMACVGDGLVLFRGAIKGVVRERMSAWRRAGGRHLRVANGPRILNATGMGLAAAITREERESPGLESVLRMLSSTEGPQRMGIGVLPRALRILAAIALAQAAAGSLFLLISAYPAALPWIVAAVVVAFATRPDANSFRAWVKDRAPEVAQTKQVLVDRLRARAAPYVMGLRPPAVRYYGLFTVVTVCDHADYVYVYLGCLSRWCLLGWYNAREDWNFDRISPPPERIPSSHVAG